MRAPQKSGPVIPQRLKWHGKLAALAIYLGIRALSSTWRVRFSDEAGERKGPFIYALWHNGLALCMTAYHGYAKRKWPPAGLAALISASKDGALLARVLKYFEVTPVRGSSSRRGRQALLELTRQIESGTSVAITPDGPKGPKYRVQEGIVALAQVTGAPIMPCTIEVSSKWTLGSWDGFQIPKPFARCEIRFGAPLEVARNADPATREAVRADLERRMMETTAD